MRRHGLFQNDWESELANLFGARLKAIPDL